MSDELTDQEMYKLLDETIDMIHDPEVLTKLAKHCWDNARFYSQLRLRQGVLVEFRDKQRRTVRGRVHRINEKNVKVRVEQGNTVVMWTVSPTLLKPVQHAAPPVLEPVP